MTSVSYSHHFKMAEVAAPLLLATRPFQPAWLMSMPKTQAILGVEAQKVAMVYKHHSAVKDKAAASKVSQGVINKVGDLCRLLAFQPQYQAQFRARPDVSQGELIRVTDWKLLTPENYDRT